MPFQLTTETLHTKLQVAGGKIITFVKQEEKYVSEAVSKEIADAVAAIQGFVSKEITDAEAEATAAAIADEGKVKSAAEAGVTNMTKTALAGLRDVLRTGVEHARVLAEAKAKDALVVKLEAADHGNLKQIVDYVAQATGVNLIASAVGNIEGPVAGLTQPDTTRNTPKINSGQAAVDTTKEPDADHTGDKAAVDTAMTEASVKPASATEQTAEPVTQPSMTPPPHVSGGSGGTSWGPEDGKPAGEIAPGTVDTQAVDNAQEAKKNETLGTIADPNGKPGKNGPQTTSVKK